MWVTKGSVKQKLIMLEVKYLLSIVGIINRDIIKNLYVGEWEERQS